ncbi:OsmC family protein [Ligilactobacillus sp. LYQ135]
MRKMKMISTKSNDGYEVTNDTGEMIFKCDESKAAGGSGQYPRPTDYLLGALGSCLNITIRSMAKREGFEVKQLKIIITGDVELAGIFNSNIRNGFYNLKLKIEMDSNIPSEKKEEFLQKCMTACPVHETIENATDIKWDY